jgi:hypothetical protein
MAVISRVNPNFPIPGIDQSSKGFRDNFSTIKSEIEALQGKNIVLTGDVQANPALIDSGSGDIVIDCVVAVANIAAGGSNLSIQYNIDGVLTGNNNFIYQPSTGNVALGTQNVDAARLNVNGTAKFKERVVIETKTDDFVTEPRMIIRGGTPDWGVLDISTGNSSVAFNSVGANGYNFKIESGNVAHLSNQGLFVGVGTTSWQATRMLDVKSYDPDIAMFQGLEDFVDHGIRLTTDQDYSSIGLILEHRVANAVGGIRIDNQGNVSIHSGESMNAQLSTASTRLLINSAGQVGIGTSIPRAQLDVNGTFRTRDYSVSDKDPVYVDTAFIDNILDSWPMLQYRSARYTLQITDIATGNVDVRSILMMHANGSPYITEFGSVNNAGSLGTVSTQVNGSVIELVLNSSFNTLVVKLESHYITL